MIDFFLFKLNLVFFFFLNPLQSYEGYFVKRKDGLCQNNKQASAEGTKP